MPGGALLSIYSYGSANVILNNNPDFTYYYKLFKRYSHFSFETVDQAPDGPNELSFDQSIKLRLKIPRIGDLLTDLMFTFQLPDIYSKFLNTTNNLERISQYNFQWTRYIGAQIINNVAFFVGGQKIQEFDSDYIIAKAHADYNSDTLFKWRQLIGDVPELNDPANGQWAGGQSQSSYPTVVRAAVDTPQNNRPSIFGQRVYVPLPFWFCQSASQALPIVGLQYQEAEVQLTLRPINELYTILDPSGYRMGPGFRVISSNRQLLANQAKYVSYNDPTTNFNAFAVDIGYTTPALNTWFLDPQIQLTYAYLTENERKTFASTPLNYLIYQASVFRFSGITARTLLDLDIHNPVVRLLVVPRRDDQVQARNANTNWTNWWDFPRVPWQATPGASQTQNTVFSSGILIPNSQRDIIRSMRVLLDGTEVQEEQTIGFFTKAVPFKYVNGSATLEGQILPIVSFSLMSPGNQPSGSVNASRIRLFQIEINPYTLPPSSVYKYDMSIYAETINFFIIENGNGGLKYAI
jgi:hypothetical protein